MKKLIKFLSTSAFTLAVLFIFSGFNPADAAFPGYIKLDTIPGESTDNEHKDWIIIESMSSPLSATTGKRQHKPFVITKAVDKSSPYLQRAAESGQKFPSALISVQNPDSAGEPYLTYKLKDVLVSSYTTSGSSTAGGTVPMEEITLNYSSIELVKSKPKRAKVRK